MEKKKAGKGESRKEDRAAASEIGSTFSSNGASKKEGASKKDDASTKDGAFRKGKGVGRGKGNGMGNGRGTKVATVLYTREEACPALELTEGSGLVQVICCVDDTDDLSGDMSTGYVAERIADAFIANGAHIALGISRHQLLLSDEVAYTSHNSSMCFVAFAPVEKLDRYRELARQLIEDLSVQSADPGLCLAVLSQEEDPLQLESEIERLVSFGRKAKVALCTKEEAYNIANGIDWLELTEHGGTGLGVIGALAGVGLRLSGSDGRLRGKWDLGKLYPCDEGETFAPVGTLCAHLTERVIGTVQVVDAQGEAVSSEALLFLDSEVKPVLQDGAVTLIVDMKDGAAYPRTKGNLGDRGSFSEGSSSAMDMPLRTACSLGTVCPEFVLDTDREECDTDMKDCANCLYRRWKEQTFECALGAVASRITNGIAGGITSGLASDKQSLATTTKR